MSCLHKKILSSLAVVNIIVSVIAGTGLTVSADDTTSTNISSYQDLISLFGNNETLPKNISNNLVLLNDIIVPSGKEPLGSVKVGAVANTSQDLTDAKANVLNYNTANPQQAIPAPPYYKWMAENDFTNKADTTVIKEYLDSGLVTFTGTLDGKGHKIIGLSDSLFVDINGATVKNIGFDDVTSTNNILAKTATNSNMTNCYAHSKAVNPVIALNGLNTDNEVYQCNSLRTRYEFDPQSSTYKILTMPEYDGTAYKITNAEEFNNIASVINKSVYCEGTDKYNSQKYSLQNDISATVPLTTWGIDDNNAFTGSFDGQGYIISSTSNPMLFGYIYGNTALIKNLGVHIGEISGNTTDEYVGGIAGNAQNQSTIQDCYFVGKATSSKFGGIVGALDNSTIRSCYTRTLSEVGGGLVNKINAGKLYNCYTTQGAAVVSVENANNNEFNKCYCSSSSNGISGITVTSVADMQKPNFIPKINTSIAAPQYVYMNQQTPALTGIGEGKNPGTEPIDYYTVTITPPPAGCIFKVYDGTSYLNNGDKVAKGTTLSFSQQNTVGYVFRSYKVNDFTYPNSTYQVNADVTVAADFNVIEVYTITVKASKGGTVSPTDTSIKVNKGDTYTFTIIPDSGYKIKSVDYSGAGITNSGKYYTTSIMIKNTNLDVDFISKSENVTNVEVGNKGNIVSVKSTLDVIDIINENYGNTFKAPLSASNMLEDNVLEAIRGEAVTLILEGKDYSWSIYGKSVTSSLKSINMEVVMNGGTIPDKYLNLVKKFKDQVQLQLKHSGPFPFSAELKFNVGQEQAGRYANLFYFNPSTLTLEKISSSKVDKDGNTSFVFTHASDYVVVMADKALTTQDLSQQAGISENQQLMSDNTKSILYSGVMLLAVIVGAVVVFNIIRKRQD